MTKTTPTAAKTEKKRATLSTAQKIEKYTNNAIKNIKRLALVRGVSDDAASKVRAALTAATLRVVATAADATPSGEFKLVE